MRIDVKKWLFFGVERERKDFFKKAQETGIIEFIDSHDRPVSEVPEAILHMRSAIRVVQGMEVVEQEELDDFSLGPKIANEILALRHRDEQMREERRLYQQEIARIRVFGRFSQEDVTYIKGSGERNFQFFCGKRGSKERWEEEPGLFYVGTEHGLDYFVSITKESAQYEGMIELKIDESVDQLEERVVKIEKEITAIEKELKTYAKYDTFLHRALIDQLNQHHLHASAEFVGTHLSEKVFAVEGWVPVDKEQELHNLLTDSKVAGEPIAVEETDREPTHLVNEGMARIGEDLVHIYDTPASSDADPSFWVLGSFAVFFAIILNDGGYGLLFLLTTLFLYIKFPKVKGLPRRMMKLGTLLSISCITWGVLTNSFFGMSLPIDHPTRALSVIDRLAEKKAEYHIDRADDVYALWSGKYPALAAVVDGKQAIMTAAKEVDGEMQYEMSDKFRDNILLELALLIGVLHISFSFLRYIRRNPSGIGWILFMIGGYLYVPHYLGATSLFNFNLGLDKQVAAETGQQLMVAGIVIAVGLSIIKYKLMGFLEIANLIQVFADVLSYLRLYALALAGGIVGATVNDMSSSVGVVFGLVILFFGHAVNILLSLMGGVIHGLRLNFIEWYHYSFDGGGKPFEPLKKIATD